MYSIGESDDRVHASSTFPSRRCLYILFGTIAGSVITAAVGLFILNYHFIEQRARKLTTLPAPGKWL